MRKRPHLSAVTRVRTRVQGFLERENHKPMVIRKTQVWLANQIGVEKNSLNEWLKDEGSPERGMLARLDALAEAVDLSPAELVQAYGSRLMELSADERFLVQQWRAWPRNVRASVLRLFRYFGDLLPEEAAHRDYLMLLRDLSDEALQRELLDLRETVVVERRKRYARAQANALAAPHHTDETGRPARKYHGSK